MDIKTNLLDEYVNFVDNTKKQQKYFEIRIIFFVVILCLFLVFVLFKHLTEKHFFSTTNIQN